MALPVIFAKPMRAFEALCQVAFGDSGDWVGKDEPGHATPSSGSDAWGEAGASGVESELLTGRDDEAFGICEDPNVPPDEVGVDDTLWSGSVEYTEVDGVGGRGGNSEGVEGRFCLPEKRESSFHQVRLVGFLRR